MPPIRRFEEIEAWQLARELVNLVYGLSRQAPFEKDYALREQIRRAAISVMSNIAEGFESRTQTLFVNYLGQAKASAGEVRAQLYIALDCGYINQAEFAQALKLAQKTSAKIYHFMRYLEKSPNISRVREDGLEYDFD